MSSSSQAIRTLIVDDEPHARQGLRELLSRDPNIAVVGESRDGAEAVQSIRRLKPDLVLLDIQMPGMDGFKVIETIGVDRMPVVVFVTAHERFARAAFDVRALDYLLKPFDDERFEQAIARAKQSVRASAGGAAMSRLPVRETGRTLLIRTADIDWIEGANYCIKVHVGPRAYVLRDTLHGLERRLDPRQFVRVHRSTIVNIDRIKELQPYFHGEFVVILTDGTRLKLARRRRPALEAVLGYAL